ncbi:SUN domain-containing protein [Trichostrongylus colubriformis]|uniref:SUN domain-containing protein n=1 Tax=Trichostrongylus colubriformis TaxID=6319 RepID=A0AAN8J213_TRICO
MIERWRTTTTLVYIAVLWSCICCDNVCYADGFKSLVTSYLGVSRLTNSSCPIEVSLQFDHDLSSEHTLGGAATLSSSKHRQPRSAGNCTNNLTAADSLRHPPSKLPTETTEDDSSTQKATEEPHQPIVTFDEWTKEKLKQEHRKVLVPPSPAAETGTRTVRVQQLPPGAAATRNYASKECGAKVLLSNPEAENTKAILNEKEKDEYMRNPCEKAANKFVILELCETVQPLGIELANYELFSSGPRTIRLWATERFPAGEWQLLTEITVADSRQIQQFPIPNKGAYVKFIKVELLSHYGNEHYCTLSVLKILGISMVDEYEAEAEAASVVQARTSVGSTEVKPNGTSIESPDTIPTSVASGATSQQAQTLESDSHHGEPQSNGSKDETESKPTVIEIVDKVVSGDLIKKIVDVVKDNFAVVKGNSERHSREYKVSSSFMACYFCPSDGTYIYPQQFCQAFVWKSTTPPPSAIQSEVTLAKPVPTTRRGTSSAIRSRRSRFTYRQRRLHHRPRSTVLGNDQHQAAPSTDNNKQRDTQPSKVAADVQPNGRSQPVPSDAWPAASTSHKESVFMKLNKRIAALELNMSLSSEYLSELSRQYVAQTDEHQKHLKQARKVVEEAVETIYARVNETLADKIAALRKEVDTLSGWLTSMRATASKMTVSRYARGAERADDDKCILKQTDLHRYSPPDDGLWTTEQVVYTVVFTQIFTVFILSLLSLCYQRFVTRQQFSVDQRAQVEELVNERVMEMLGNNCSTLQRYDKQVVLRTKQRSPSVEEMPHPDASVNFMADCSSSSPTTNSDESSTEEVPVRGRMLMPSELRAISSVALLT